MTEQQQRAHLVAGLSTRLTDNDGLIVRPAWLRAFDGKELVGSCRQPIARGGTCPGYLTVSREPEQFNQVWWYSAACLKCGHEVTSPNGKTLPRSSARSEMPDGGWERRMKAINGAFGKERA